MFKDTNSHDKTMIRNYIKIWKDLVTDYELIKAGNHPSIKKLNDFYKMNKICRQNFLKFYNRFKITNSDESLIPQRRGPKYSSRRPDLLIEEAVIAERLKGNSKYEIYEILKPKYSELTPSPSAIYRMLCRRGYNKLKVEMKEEKRKIIKEKIGELGHIDCYHLPKGIIKNYHKKLYLVGVIDDCGRLAWCELLSDLTSLSTMFGIMRCFTALKANYRVEFIEIMTDNGAEFGGNCKNGKFPITNPVKRFFHEVGIKHTHTRPYRPQTNGKIERFWRTLNEDFIEDSVFNTEEEFKEELFKYLIYYNEYRPHQSLNGKKPAEYTAEQMNEKIKK